jgi:plasmid stabilization system protein ParE
MPRLQEPGALRHIYSAQNPAAAAAAVRLFATPVASFIRENTRGERCIEERKK